MAHTYSSLQGGQVKTETLSPEQVLLTDEIANEKYVGFYAERKLSRMVIAAGSVLLLGSFGVIVSLSHRPVQTRYIRIDDMGKATAIQYSDLAYSPREGEVRTYLTDWANYRYTINRETISKKYPMNYYFLSTQLANQYMVDDNAAHLVSQVLSNQIEQSDVEIDGVTITSMSQENVKDTPIARGTALVNITKIFSPRNSRQPRKEHWVLSVTYYLNPAQVSFAAQTFPQFETINPLGLTITEFHENRLSVDPIDPSSSSLTAAAATVAVPAGNPRAIGRVR
jgi:type IV secretion system protein VirB5